MVKVLLFPTYPGASARTDEICYAYQAQATPLFNRSKYTISAGLIVNRISTCIGIISSSVLYYFLNKVSSFEKIFQIDIFTR